MKLRIISSFTLVLKIHAFPYGQWLVKPGRPYERLVVPSRRYHLIPIASAYRDISMRALPVLSDEEKTNLSNRLDLGDKFGRWRFLQKLLEQEADPLVVNRLLHAVVENYWNLSTVVEQDGSMVAIQDASPERTKGRLEAVSKVLERASHGSIDAMRFDTSSAYDMQVLQELEKLLPDTLEEEDDHKGTWDTIIELHGRESVKINEQSGSEDWRVTCLVARVLVYYDFLSNGII